MHYPNESFDSEGNYIGKHSRRATDNMSNGNNKPIWDIIFKVSQLVAPLILVAMVYLLVQQSGMDRRIAVIEVKIGSQPVDIAMVQKIAVIEDRQNGVMRHNDRQDDQIRAVEALVMQHREKSSYDNPKYPR